MARPVRRKPPRMHEDRIVLDYDFSPRHGWGTYPSRGERNGSLLVWEDRDRIGNVHPTLSRLSEDSLTALVTVGRALGME